MPTPRKTFAAAQAEARGSITARMWVYRSITAPINVFDFTGSRHQEGPEIFLDGFTGSLMADCYAGYDSVETKSDGRIIRAACVAHAQHMRGGRSSMHGATVPCMPASMAMPAGRSVNATAEPIADLFEQSLEQFKRQPAAGHAVGLRGHILASKSGNVAACRVAVEHLEKEPLNRGDRVKLPGLQRVTDRLAHRHDRRRITGLADIVLDLHHRLIDTDR